jgi:hypothetical protein
MVYDCDVPCDLISYLLDKAYYDELLILGSFLLLKFVINQFGLYYKFV